ncbi:hypothetical protein GEMRC1_007359 [Eukaryota sp. GEM-RC1]
MPTCRNCSSNPVVSHISRGEKICPECLKRLSRVVCCYCRIDFHQLERDAKNPEQVPVCDHCKHNLNTLQTEPSYCEFCGNKAAWTGSLCHNCDRQRDKYGEPCQCIKCNLYCAFRREPDMKDDQLMCLLCTRAIKLDERDKSRKRRSSVMDDYARTAELKEHLEESGYREMEAQMLLDRYERQRGVQKLDNQKEIDELRKQLVSKSDQMEQLQQDNVKLRRQLAELRGRMEQMHKDHQRDQDASSATLLKDMVDDLRSENAKLKAALLRNS